MATSPEYYDIVLLGRSGQGKTDLAKKLGSGKSSKIHTLQSPGALPSIPDLQNYQASNSPEPTKVCELQTNEESKVRVLDVPGFSGGTLQENLQIIEFVGKAQDKFQLKVSRVVYFLPSRGPLEKADGSMQEELKMLNHYFGKEIFDCVVVAATNSKRYQQVRFDEDDFKMTTQVFHTALKSAVGEDIQCPPIIYVGLDDDPNEILHKIQSAPIIKKNIIVLAVKDAGPLYPPLHTKQEQSEKITASQDGFSEKSLKESSGKTLQEDRNKEGRECSDTEKTAPQEDHDKKDPEESLVKGQGANNSHEGDHYKGLVKGTVPINEQPTKKNSAKEGPSYELLNRPTQVHKQHSLVPKYSVAQRIIGGIAHVITFGIPFLVFFCIYKRAPWPCFLNSEKVCEHCKNNFQYNNECTGPLYHKMT